jgi:hypothetical protein
MGELGLAFDERPISLLFFGDFYLLTFSCSAGVKA